MWRRAKDQRESNTGRKQVMRMLLVMMMMMFMMVLMEHEWPCCFLDVIIAP